MRISLPERWPLDQGTDRKNQVIFMVDGILINVAYLLTTGFILSGYLICLGTEDFLVALLNNSVNFSSILSIFSYLIYERLKTKKTFLLAANLASRTGMVLIVLLPVIGINSSLMFVLLTVLIITADAIWGIYRVGWSVWMMSSLSQDIKSQYVYLRNFLIRLFVLFFYIGAGILLDYYDKQYIGFAVIFGFSYLLSLLDVAILKGIAEKSGQNRQRRLSGLSTLFDPCKNKPYRMILLFIFGFYLLQTLSTSFTSLYLIRYLQFDFSLISAANVLSMLVMLITNRIWSRAESRFGFRFVLGFSGLFLALELPFIAMVGSHTGYLLFVSAMMSGIGNGGFVVSLFTYRYQLMPADSMTLYEGWYYFAAGCSMLIGPFLGKILMRIFDVLFQAPDQNHLFQWLYLASFIALLALLFVSFFKPARRRESS